MLRRKNILASFLFSVVFLFADPAQAQWDPNSLSGFGLPSGSVYSILAGLLSWVLAIFFLVGLIGFIISGLMYLTAAGSDTQIEKAKKAMKFSIIGVIVGLSGFVIIQAITVMLGGSSFIF